MRRLVCLALAGIVAVACSTQGAVSAKPLVLTSTTLFADMAKNVGGDRVRVASIVPAGAHVEEYEPKPEDSRRVSEASLFFVNGLDLDTWVNRLLRDKKAAAPIVTLSDGLPTIEHNPHLWFDLSLGRQYVEKMRDALIALDPDGKDAYAENARRYDAELVKADDEVRARIATIPADRRKLVSSHDAFPYFAKAYGLEVVGFAQVEPGKDPTPAELADLVQKIRTAHVPAIFSETGVSPQIAQTIARETGVTTIVTDLPTDSVVAPPADTYAGVVRTVAQKIADALR